MRYTPDYFEPLRRAAEQMGVPSLSHKAFVDYYYATRDWCWLDLVVLDDGSVVGTNGVELMPFEFDSKPLTVAFSTNTYSRHPGAGGYLFLHGMRRSDLGVTFGGTRDMHRMLNQQKWTYFEGIRTYRLNPRFRPAAGDAAWRVVAKRLLDAASPRTDVRKRVLRAAGEARSGVTAHEEAAYGEDMIPRRSPFKFRFAPSLEYLRWRYDTRLSFVRYRLFRIREAGSTAGYVILNDSPERLFVSQCDGEDPATLAYGVLASIAQAVGGDRSREVLLTSSHPVMQRVFRRCGFVTRRRWNKPFALGSRRRRVDLPPDTSNWLINFDWGDNGLRAPFRDQI